MEVLLKAIVQALREGDKVQIRGFGTFGTRRRSGRMGRNPNTGAAVEIAAKTIHFFKPSKKLVELINSSGPAPQEALLVGAAPEQQPEPESRILAKLLKLER